MAGPGPDNVLLFDGFRFDRQAGGLFRVNDGGAASLVPLGSRALDLLALLARHNGETVTKEEIMTVVWSGRAVEEANLNVQVSKLRHILDQDRTHGSCIQTVTGYGYRFVAAVTPIDRAAMSLDDISEISAYHTITAAPPLVAEPVDSKLEPRLSRGPVSIDVGSFLISKLGASGAIDEELTGFLLDLRHRLIDDYGDGAAALLLIEQVLAGYQEFIRVAGWISSLSATIEDELSDARLSNPHPPDRQSPQSPSTAATTGVGQHIAQLCDGLVPLAEQCAGVMRNALATLEAFRITPSKDPRIR